MHHRVEPANRGLGGDRSVAVPQHDIKCFIVDMLLNALVNLDACLRIDLATGRLRQFVDQRIVDVAVIEPAGLMIQRIVKTICLPDGKEVHHRHLEVAVDPHLA